MPNEATEWEDGYIKTDIAAFREQYMLGDVGSGIRALAYINDKGERTGRFVIQIRFGEDIVQVRLTPADVGRLHEQALKGGVMFSILDSVTDDDSRDIFRGYQKGLDKTNQEEEA